MTVRWVKYCEDIADREEWDDPEEGICYSCSLTPLVDLAVFRARNEWHYQVLLNPPRNPQIGGYSVAGGTAATSDLAQSSVIEAARQFALGVIGALD